MKQYAVRNLRRISKVVLNDVDILPEMEGNMGAEYLYLCNRLQNTAGSLGSVNSNQGDIYETLI
jgi:hypothetical protein